MVEFRYTCLRHRQMFVAAAEREGCRDPEQMERVRRHMLAWLSEKFPYMVLDRLNAQACLGCALEAAHVVSAEMHDAFRDIARTGAPGAPPTDARQR